MRLLEAIFACALGLTAACSSDPAGLLPPPVDHDAQGSWGQDNHGALTPGNSFVMALTESSGTITGVGSFAGEAGPYGALRVAGTVADDSVHLQIVYVPEPTVFPQLRVDTAQFAGVLTAKDHIAGRLAHDGTTQPFDLVRLTIDDPP
jgi:hypothetical protein